MSKLENSGHQAETTLKVSKAFTCPRCGRHRLEEVVRDVTMFYEIVECYDDGYAEVSFSNANGVNTGGVIDRYQCENCGWVVPDVTDALALFAWLLKHKEASRAPSE